MQSPEELKEFAARAQARADQATNLSQKIALDFYKQGLLLEEFRKCLSVLMKHPSEGLTSDQSNFQRAERLLRGEI